MPACIPAGEDSNAEGAEHELDKEHYQHMYMGDYNVSSKFWFRGIAMHVANGVWRLVSGVWGLAVWGLDWPYIYIVSLPHRHIAHRWPCGMHHGSVHACARVRVRRA